MRKREERAGAEFVRFDEAHAPGVRAARRRVEPIVALWASYPAITGLDLFWLAVSCYLQGAADGFDVCERTHAKEGGAK